MYTVGCEKRRSMQKIRVLVVEEQGQYQRYEELIAGVGNKYQRCVLETDEAD